MGVGQSTNWGLVSGGLSLLKRMLKNLFPFLFSSKTYLAYGVEEGPNRYPLYAARNPLMAAYIHQEASTHSHPIRVLDVGCRDGSLLLYCRHNHSSVEFHGMDHARSNLKTALGRGYHSGLAYDIRDRPFPYKNNCFDAVICSHVLEHLERPGSVLDELHRIMKKGGLLVVGTPTDPLPLLLWRRHIIPIYDPKRGKQEAGKIFGHVSFFSLRELKRLLTSHGFVPEDARGNYFIRSRGLFLENYKWWYELNQCWGRVFPGLGGHVTVKARSYSK